MDVIKEQTGKPFTDRLGIPAVKLLCTDYNKHLDPDPQPQKEVVVFF
jgi:hypothetical protein